MKEMRVIEFGGPQALGVHGLRNYHAGRGDGRIRVLAAAASPTDAELRRGQYDVARRRGPAQIPGMDAPGVIDKVAAGSQGKRG